jgi:hypothetical protein
LRGAVAEGTISSTAYNFEDGLFESASDRVFRYARVQQTRRLAYPSFVFTRPLPTLATISFTYFSMAISARQPLWRESGRLSELGAWGTMMNSPFSK